MILLIFEIGLGSWYFLKCVLASRTGCVSGSVTNVTFFDSLQQHLTDPPLGVFGSSGSTSYLQMIDNIVF